MRCMYDATQSTPTVRLNASGTTVDKWVSFYNSSTNTYNDAIVPLTDTSGKTVVNNASQIPSQGSLMSIPTGFLTTCNRNSLISLNETLRMSQLLLLQECLPFA